MANPESSILNLDPEAFVAALDELGLPPEERAFLEQQYFAQNRALPMTERPEGRRVGMIAPMSWPEGMTGAEALMSGEADFAVPEFIRGLYEAPAEAANVAGATVRGIPVTEEQMQQAAQGAAEVFTGIGPATFAARSAVRGVEMPDASTVSMSGVRGMGDNGGPSMLQRYINPETGLYSPSYEAARALPQEVGTAEQMRAMLLKGGAKEEELLYTGLERWFKERSGQKVTKKELENILAASAAGVDGNMPYVPVREQSSGVVGFEKGLGDYQDQIYQDLLDQARDQRDARIFQQVNEQGYDFAIFDTEEAYRTMADKVKDLYSTARRGFTADGQRLPPAAVYNAINSIDRMLSEGTSFSDPAVQRQLNRMRDPDILMGPSGVPEFSEEVIRRLLPEEARNPYFGAIPTSMRDEATSRAYNMSEQEVADLLGVDVEDVLQGFTPGRTVYGTYAPKGLKNYSENLYMFDDTGRGVVSEAQGLGATPFALRHFNQTQGDRAPLMFHTRTGEFMSEDGPVYHIAEIQSDIGQSYNEDPKGFFVPGSTEPVPKLTKPQKEVLQTYVDMGKKYRELAQAAEDSLERLYDNYFDIEEGVWNKGAPGYEDARNEIVALREQANAARKSVLDMEEQNWDFLYGDLVNTYQTPRLLSAVDSLSLPTADFDPGQFEEILAGTVTPKKFAAAGKAAALPFATSTNRWVDAALKNELVNAARSGAEWFTLPMGEDVVKYTYGELEGQKKFYEGIVPTRLKELSRKFLDKAPIQQIEVRGMGSDAPTYRVNGIRLTPELRQKILEEGLPSFAKGGPVTGSSLDVDVFAFR